MKEHHFLLLDVSWIRDFYYAENDIKDKDKVYDKIRSLFQLEDLIDLCLSQKDTDFIYDLVQPSVEDNTISQEGESKIYSLLDGVFIEIQDSVANAIDQGLPNKDFKTYNLVGFLGTTAVVALSETEPQKYPSFKDLYGNIRDKHWKAKELDSSVLKTFVPSIRHRCEPEPI